MVDSSPHVSKTWYEQAKGAAERSRFTPYLVALCVAALSVLLRFPLNPWLGPVRAAFLIPFCAITFVAVFYGFVPALVTEILCATGVVFFLLPPRFTFRIEDPDLQANFITFAAGTFVCALFGSVVHRARLARDEMADQIEQTLSNAATGLTRCNRDLRYVMVNPAYASVLGMPPNELIGRKIADVLGEDVVRIRPYIDRVLGGEPVEYQIELPVGHLGKRWFNVNHAPDRDGGGGVVGWVTSVDDITDRKQAERRIEEDLATMTRLRDIGALTARADADVKTCLEEILGAAITFTKASKGNIQLIADGSDVLKVAVHRGFEKPFLDFFAEVDVSEASACGTALKNLERIVVDNVNMSEIFMGQHSLQVLLNEGIQAVQSTPLVSSTGRVLGMLSTHFSVPHRPSERKLGLIDLLARQAADMIERRSAQEQLELNVVERTRELRETSTALQAESEARIREQNERIELLGRLIEGQEAERTRIGRDIHDHLGQRLTALRLQLQSLKDVMAIDPTGETARSRVESLDQLSQELDAEVSYLAWELRPVVLDQFGLVETLRLFVQEWSKQNGVVSEFEAGKLENTAFDKEAETHLYRITQEALNNIAKHARAQHVSVQLALCDGKLSLVIDDDGCGFNPNGKSKRKDSLGGLGLRGMHERAELIGGQVEIQSKPGKGTAVFVQIADKESKTESQMAAG